MASSSNNNNTGCIFLVVIVAGIWLLKKYIVAGTLNVFIFLDKLLSFGGDTSFAGWIILGVLAGLAFGAWVAYKKYNLQPGFVWGAGGLVLVYLVVLFLVNDPLRDEAYALPGGSKTEEAYELVEVGSSSFLAPEKDINYSPFNVTDHDDNTAWIENGKYAGLGEKIEFTFKPAINNYTSCKCIGFIFKNGYAKTKKLWTAHNRVRSFTVYLNGSYIGASDVADTFNEVQKINISPIVIKDGDRLSMAINSIYRGTRYPEQTAITALVPVIEYMQ